MLNYSDSSPSYTLLEIPKEVVKSHEQEYDMFTEDPQRTTNYISALKLDQHLTMAMNGDLNMLNNNGGSSRGGLKTSLNFNPELFTNFMGQGKTRPRTPLHALTRPHTPSALLDPKPHALSRL